ncbi:Hypothetical predicted protein [Cloeon dipterum]|uniref:Uncharacterized protein n=1 Tax=Cloeon dipterum TaxID=197152 RepID=A0A8S1CLC2_9INSE|nr:Hypothetical predicted protein [Cloeon dipterum]
MLHICSETGTDTFKSNFGLEPRKIFRALLMVEGQGDEQRRTSKNPRHYFQYEVDRSSCWKTGARKVLTEVFEIQVQTLVKPFRRSSRYLYIRNRYQTLTF